MYAFYSDSDRRQDRDYQQLAKQSEAFEVLEQLDANPECVLSSWSRVTCTSNF